MPGAPQYRDARQPVKERESSGQDTVINMQFWLEIWTWQINALASVEEEMLHERAVLSMVGDVPLFSIFFYISCYITTHRADSGITYWVFSWPSSSSTSSSSTSSSYQQWLLGEPELWVKLWEKCDTNLLQDDTSLYGWKISKTKPTYILLPLETTVQTASLSESKSHKF